MLTLMNVLLALLGLSLVLAFARLVRGPTLADRVVALDVLTIIGVGMAALHAIAYGQPVFLDVAIVMALLSFIGTVAFARYLELRRVS